VSEVRFEPVENALDYLASAADQLGEGVDARDLKYGVLHLYAGMEVLAKAVLLRQAEDWREVVVLSQRSDMTRERFDRGDFRSVGPVDALRRLAALGHSTLEDKDLEAIEKLGRLRNRLQHFGLVEEERVVIARATPVLSSAVRLLGRNFAPEDFKDREAELYSEVRRALEQFQEFLDEHLAAIEADFDDSLTATECPRCGQLALELDGEGSGRCLFCTERPLAEEMAGDLQSWALHASKGVDERVHECPECEQWALVENMPTRKLLTEGYVCLACGFQAEGSDLNRCGRCGVPYLDRYESVMCDACVAYELDRD